MPRDRRNAERCVPSILDRLIEDTPWEATTMTDRQLRKKAVDSVRRDLENLLNTRWRCTSWPPSLDELETSLVNYGIPDFTSVGSNIAERPDVLLDHIEAAIAHFEPRLTQVELTQIGVPGSVDRTFRFRIRAKLNLPTEQSGEMFNEPVSFESTLEASSGNFDVTGAGR